MKGKTPFWQWLVFAAFVLGFLLAGLLPSVDGSHDLSDYEWPAIRLRFCLYMPLCLLIMAVIFYPIRALKWFLRGLVMFLLLLILFYVEEDWRGKRAWDQFHREWEAKGENFDYASLIPPAIPDDQNFALTPIVASCYSRYLDTSGHRCKPENTNVANRLAMTIYRSDYVAGATNATLGNWQLAKRIQLDAWQAYYRAPVETNRYCPGTNCFPRTPTPQTPAADVLFALGNFTAPLEELRQAANHYRSTRFPLNYEHGSPLQLILPHLPAFGNCGQVLELRASAELADRQNENALADIQLSLMLAKSLQHEPVLYSQLARLGLISDAIQPVWEGTSQHQWTDGELSALEQNLGTSDILADYPFALRIGRANGLATIEFMRCNRSRAFNCIRVIDNLSAYDDYWEPPDLDTPMEFTQQLFCWLIPNGWFYANETTVGQIYQPYLLTTNVEKGEPEFTAIKRAEMLRFDKMQHFSPYTAIASMMIPGIGLVARRFMQTQSALDLARLACALERYRLAHAGYPDKLEVLEPQFMQAVPRDVITGKPLNYRRTPDGNFVLYSVGWNETDDGGTPGATDHGYNDYTKGDWVWQNSAH